MALYVCPRLSGTNFSISHLSSITMIPSIVYDLLTAGPSEMARWLRAPATLAEDPSVLPSINMRWLSHM